MKMLISALVLVTTSIVAAQRGSFAGTKPIGFPDTPNRTTTTPDPLGNRFGDPQTLPIEANGDWDLIDRLSKLPVDKQPFWYINWKAYDKQRKDPPQTFPQRPNPFLDPLSLQLNPNSGQGNNGFSTPTPGFIGTKPTVIFNRFGTTVPSQPSNNVSPNGNLNNNASPVSNMYPSSNVNGNSNFNVYPSGNSSPTSNIYNNNNPNYNVDPTGNTNSNVHPTDNPNSNVYPTINPNSNVYISGNPNSNVYQTSNLNSHSNTGTVTKNGASFQTTQNFQWESSHSFVSSNVGSTNLKTHPEYYPRTDTYPQSGQLFF